MGLAYKFTNAEFIVQKAELDFAQNPHPASAMTGDYDNKIFNDLKLGVIEGDMEIIDGVFSLLGVIGVITAIIAVGSGPYFWGFAPEVFPVALGIVQTILVIAAIFLAIVGILPLLGGIYALQRRKWGLGLAGSIAAIFGSTPLGIAATVLMALAKDEFE